MRAKKQTNIFCTTLYNDTLLTCQTQQSRTPTPFLQIEEGQEYTLLLLRHMQ